MRRLIFCVIGLIIAGSISWSSADAQTPADMNQAEISIDRQQLASSSLLLDITAAQSANLSGSVKINGEIFPIQRNRSMDLNQCLRVTICEVDVMVSAQPTDMLELKIYSTNGAVNFTHQSSFNGSLRQKFKLNLR